MTEKKYLPFLITVANEQKSDEPTTSHHSDDGKLYIRIGNVDIRIKQLEDGSGFKLSITDSATCMQDLREEIVLFDEVEEDKDEPA